jgi:hypothetical protein
MAIMINLVICIICDVACQVKITGLGIRELVS